MDHHTMHEMPPMPDMNCTCVMDMMTMNMMPMYFHFNTQDRLWFEGWNPQNPWGFFGTCLFICAFAFLKEFLFHYRKKRRLVRPVNVQDSISHKPLTSPGSSPVVQERHFADKERAIDSALYMINLTFSYLLMLVVMTFNVTYCLVAVLSSGVAFYFFSNGNIAPSIEPETDCCESGE